MIYKPFPTLKPFHLDRTSFVRAIIGPIGSGKSVACVVELLLRAYEQPPSPEDNIRRSRFAIIRNTYRELSDTTMQTFFDWIPKSSGTFSAMNLKFTHTQSLPDGTSIQSEFMFRALDRPQDVKKLLSLELTGAWINECREIPKQIVDMLQGRVGRYPRMSEGGAKWFGVIMDTNPPDSDHWFYKLFEETKPSNHRLFHQPSGTSPQAENIPNLPANYYQNMQAGKDQEWINVYVHGLYGFIADGKPIFPEYRDDIHCPSNAFRLLNDLDLSNFVNTNTNTDTPTITTSFRPPSKSKIYVGIDFGLTPAAVFGYLTPAGRMIIFDELCTFDMGAISFGKLLKEKIMNSYPDNIFEIYADPAGEQRAQTDEITPFLILQNQGINASPTYTNDFTIRREAVADYMQRLDFTGLPAFCVTTNAPTVRKGLAGGYKYKRMLVSGADRYQDKPDKGKYSHACDALQYLFLGAVGGSRVIGGWDDSKQIDYTLHDRTIV